ncbi:MAG TPA: hypothetical protein VII45_04080 [Solirubrobacterales bacterium]
MRGALSGAWEFVVGDDWIGAAGVVAMLGLTAVLAAADLPAWWLSPIATLAILRWSLRRELRSRSRL